jgi:hypothetical protein
MLATCAFKRNIYLLLDELRLVDVELDVAEWHVPRGSGGCQWVGTWAAPRNRGERVWSPMVEVIAPGGCTARSERPPHRRR